MESHENNFAKVYHSRKKYKIIVKNNIFTVLLNFWKDDGVSY